MTGLHERLRHATRAEHLALERDLSIASRIEDRGEVTLILARFYGFFEPLERGVAATLGAEAMAGRERLGEIGHDLRALGLTKAELGRLPRSPESGLFGDAGEALGALYVTEGARLGGRVIARALSESGWVPAGGLRFWSDDPRTGSLWRSYLDRLNAPDAVAMGPSVERGALTTFQRLHRWFASGGIF